MKKPQVGKVYVHRALATYMPRPYCLVEVDEVGDGFVVVRVPGNEKDNSQSVPLEGFFFDYYPDPQPKP